MTNTQSNSFLVTLGWMMGIFEAYSPFHQAVRAIKRGGYRVVGLQTDVNDPTYPLWPLLKEVKRKDVVLRQMTPRNLSRKIPDGTAFDAVLVSYETAPGPLIFNGISFVEVWREGGLALFEKTMRER